MFQIACDVLWYGYIAVSIALVCSMVIASAGSGAVSLAALLLTSAFHFLAVFRITGTNSDTIAYASYSELARKLSALCFMAGVRFEPLNSALMWGAANLTGDYHLYLLIMAAIIVGSNVVLYRIAGERYAVFAAMTFPQFAMVQSMATVRWGVALHILAISMVLLDKRGFILRGAGGFIAIMFHFATAIAAAAMVFKTWYLRIGIVVVATVAIAFLLPTAELPSGSGLRYIGALLLSASLMITAKASPRTDAAYRDHLVLVACAAIMSSLYLVSPHLTRFAVALLFVSYVPLIIPGTPLLRNRVALLTLAIVPVIVLGIEVRTSSCTVWAGDRSEVVRAAADAASVQYEAPMAAQSAIFTTIFGAGATQCDAI